jgi:hypothetical protein
MCRRMIGSRARQLLKARVHDVEALHGLKIFHFLLNTSARLKVAMLIKISQYLLSNTGL